MNAVNRRIVDPLHEKLAGRPVFLFPARIFSMPDERLSKTNAQARKADAMDMNNRLPPPFLAQFWRRLIPFWLFRDASHGSVEQKVANYRYNRMRRGLLPPFILTWMGMAVCLMMSLHICSGLARQTIEGSGIHVCVVALSATVGIAFAFSCVVIAVLTVCYLFLSRPDN
jgi:hypothetical protein